MRAGHANKRVVFQVESQTSDGGGGYAVTWSTTLTVWGAYAPGRGREALEAGRLEVANAGVLRVRSSTEAAAITTAHRVLIDGVAHQIRSITNPDQRGRELEIVVERGVTS